jgi:uncharacterized protein YggE
VSARRALFTLFTLLRADTAGMTDRPAATVAVRGTATADVPPDYATVAVHVRRVDADRADAERAVAGEVAAVRQALGAAAGVRAAYFAKVRVTRQPVLDDQRRKVDDGDWDASVAGTVEVDASSVDDVLATLTATGVAVTGVYWGLDDDNPAYREVRARAVRDARRAADDFAAALNRPLGDLVRLADQTFAGPRTGGWAAAGEPTLTVDPAPITVHAAVEATYLLAG